MSAQDAVPDGVMAAAVPVLATFAMQDGNGFPSHSGAVSGKLRRSIGLVPNTQAYQWHACFFKQRSMLPGAGHDDPAPSLHNGVGAEFGKLPLGQAVKTDLGSSE